MSRNELIAILRICGLVFVRFLLVGVVFSVAALVISLFQSGVRAAYLRYLSAGTLLVLAVVGLFRSGWIFVSYYVKRPKE
jgi:hypothetical protein